MTNDHEVRGHFDDLAQLAYGLDAERLIAGAERRRRRRTAGGAVLVATLTAAVIGAVTAVTGPVQSPQQGADDLPATQLAPSSPQRGAPGPGQRVDYVDPLAGVPAGDAALEQISWTEVKRRCALRGADAEDLEQIYPPVFRAGLVVTYPLGDPRSEPVGAATGCLIPGDSKPTAAGRAAYQANPIPTDRASQLGNCSVVLWHDVRNWHVLAAAQEPGIEARLVLRSPNGRRIAWCRLTSRSFGPWSEAEMLRDMNIYPKPTRPPGPAPDSHEFSYAGSCEQLASTRVMPPCTGWLVAAFGRIRTDAVRAVLTSRTGARHEVTVTDGWYAVSWLDPFPRPDPIDRPDLGVTLYNAAGEVIYRR